jgi:phage shock protein E
MEEVVVIDPKAVIVDVRTQWEYEAGHIPNARHIPLEEVAFRISDFRKMEGPVVLYCRSGNRSGLAVRLLKQAGLNNVYNGGGLTDVKQIMPNSC